MGRGRGARSLATAPGVGPPCSRSRATDSWARGTDPRTDTSPDALTPLHTTHNTSTDVCPSLAASQVTVTGELPWQETEMTSASGEQTADCGSQPYLTMLLTHPWRPQIAGMVNTEVVTERNAGRVEAAIVQNSNGPQTRALFSKGEICVPSKKIRPSPRDTSDYLIPNCN